MLFRSVSQSRYLGLALFNSVIQPVMAPNDDYLFVEQYMGLMIPGQSPAPSGSMMAGSPSPSQVASPVASASPSPIASVKTGDIDGNGKVDIFDYNVLLTNFGKTGTNLQGDFDKNGKVDIFDYNTLITNFGK